MLYIFWKPEQFPEMCACENVRFCFNEPSLIAGEAIKARSDVAIMEH